jgi:hypothetical protein
MGVGKALPIFAHVLPTELLFVAFRCVSLQFRRIVQKQ